MGRRRFTTAVAVVAATSALLGCRALDEANSRSAPWQTSKTGQTSTGGATATSVQRVYVVQSGDTLHSIAERECGSGASVESTSG